MKKSVVLIGCMLPVASMGMADRTMPVYGRPTLYGEYEISGADRRRAAAIYGAVPKNVAEKMPVKAQQVIPKKSVGKKKNTARAAAKQKKIKKKVEPLKTDEVVVVSPQDAIAPQPTVVEKKIMPSEAALAIATAAQIEDAPSIESFCSQRRTQTRGPLPDGIILMPGRPDLMSCSDK